MTAHEELAVRRFNVSQLTAEGLSQRTIARKLDISRDTVVRDQRALRAAEEPGAHQEETVVRTGTDVERTTGAAGAHQPVLVLELDAELAADLAVLVPEGGAPQEVVRTVLHDVAATYRAAVRTGVLRAGPFVIESMALAVDPVAGPRPPL